MSVIKTRKELKRARLECFWDRSKCKNVIIFQMQVNRALFDRQEKRKSMGFGKESIFAPFSFHKVVEIKT